MLVGDYKIHITICYDSLKHVYCECISSGYLQCYVTSNPEINSMQFLPTTLIYSSIVVAATKSRMKDKGWRGKRKGGV